MTEYWCCPLCRQQNDVWLNYCRYCGEPKDGVIITCPNCGTTVSTKVDECSKCGYDLIEYIRKEWLLESDAVLQKLQSRYVIFKHMSRVVAVLTVAMWVFTFYLWFAVLDYGTMVASNSFLLFTLICCGVFMVVTMYFYRYKNLLACQIETRLDELFAAWRKSIRQAVTKVSKRK